MDVKKDPVQIAPDVYKIIFENDRIRVLEIRMKPGSKTAMHYHPAGMAYVISGGKAKMTMPDGNTMDMQFTPGAAMEMPAGSHAVENISGQEAHALQIELK